MSHVLIISMILQKEYFGCEKEKYYGANFTGKAALILAGKHCTFEKKVKLAAEAGAEIVVIMNNFVPTSNDIETMFIGGK